LERKLAESRIARCVKCGAPPGPEASIVAVERRLGIKGDVSGRQLQS
jgi:hypothetical protein